MTTTEVARQSGHSTDLTIAAEQTQWTDRQVATLRQLGVGNASPADLAVYFHQCVRTGLDPFARQIYMIERQGKQTIQTGIDGFRLIARRAVDRAAETLGYGDSMWCGPDGQWVDVWLSPQAPAAAKVTVLRDGQPFPATALYTEYAALKRDGSPTQMWATKPALMLAKCAEALALRKAFPQDLSGIYTSDEMGQSTNPAGARPPVPGPSRDWLAELAECTDKECTRVLYREASAAGALTDEVKAAFVARAAELPDAEQPEPDVVDAEVMEDTPAGVNATTGELLDLEDPPGWPDTWAGQAGQS